jgi:hypothetical protein
MTGDLVCWKCGASVADLPLPLSRRAECPACRADLHVCRMCRFFDRSARLGCKEPVADPVQDKTRANFCAWFQPRSGAFAPADDAAERASRDLRALFGETAPDAAAGPGAEASPEERARRAWKSLFGEDDKA